MNGTNEHEGREEKNHPDFPQWVKTEEGKTCLEWPISEPKYLYNRLFWAFDAGRNCVWKQYVTQKEQLAKERALRKEMVEVLEFIESEYSYSNKRVSDEAIGMIMKALENQKAKSLDENK